MNGWIKMYRDIQEHWIWHDEKHLKWWLIIIMTVNHEPKKFTIGTELFICEPGQSFRSIQQWTDLFSCSKKTTVKYFKMLEIDSMISCKILGNGNRRKHLLTVMNWDKYQGTETEMFRERKPECSANGNPNVPPNKNDKNNKNKKEVKEKSEKEFSTPIQEKKKRVQPDALQFPFSSIEFMKFWNELAATPKWKNKEYSALQTSLNQLGRYEERFAIKLMENAIAGRYQGVVFADTDETYFRWQKSLKTAQNGQIKINSPVKNYEGWD